MTIIQTTNRAHRFAEEQRAPGGPRERALYRRFVAMKRASLLRELRLGKSVDRLADKFAAEAVAEFRASGTSRAAQERLRIEVRSLFILDFAREYRLTSGLAYKSVIAEADPRAVGAVIGIAPNDTGSIRYARRAANALYQPPTPQAIAAAFQEPMAFNGERWQDRLAGIMDGLADTDGVLRNAAANARRAEQALSAIQRGTSDGTQAAIRRELRAVQDPLVAAYFRRNKTSLNLLATDALAHYHEQAKRDTFRQLGPLLDGMVYRATLDKRTRPAHARLDGTIYYSANIPDGGQSIANAPPMPNGYRCRCTYVPWLAPLNRVLNLTSQRASVGGQVSGELRYPAWFDQQPEAFRRKVVGARRWSAALATTPNPQYLDFLTSQGTFKTLAQIGVGM